MAGAQIVKSQRGEAALAGLPREFSRDSMTITQAGKVEVPAGRARKHQGAVRQFDQRKIDRGVVRYVAGHDPQVRVTFCQQQRK